MEGLSAKVFRTYNASMTLQEQLNQLEVEDNVAANVLGYNRANRAVAILCNHQVGGFLCCLVHVLKRRLWKRREREEDGKE